MAVALTLAACGGEQEGERASSTTAVTTTEVRLPEIEEPPPTAGRLIGTWSRTGSSTLFRFNPDGTFDVDTHKLDIPLYATGTYELNGPTIAFTANGPRCTDAWEWQTGIVEAEARLDDELHIVFLSSGCGIPRGAEWTLARI